mgnify:FL=1|jgi:hypothetical protein
MKKYLIPNLCILPIDKKKNRVYNKGTKLRNEVLEMSKREMVRMINDRTGEIVDKFFDDSADADDLEFLLDMMQVHYQRWSDGEILYEENDTRA